MLPKQPAPLPPDQTPPESLTQPPAAASRVVTSSVLANPLKLLFNGPQDLNELLSLAQNLAPHFPTSEIVAMLRSLENQKTPGWWPSSPQQFQKSLTDLLTPMLSRKGLSLAEQQSRILEALLNMWEEHLSSNPT